MPVQSNVLDDRIKSLLHLPQVLIRDTERKLVLDLVQQLGEIEIRIGIAGIVFRSYDLPALAKLLNVDLANPDGNVLRDTTTGAVSLIEGLIAKLRSVDQIYLKA
jgi:hypothetical protein